VLVVLIVVGVLALIGLSLSLRIVKQYERASCFASAVWSQ
jgi:type II secretory pathway pseudopilin PulG